MKRALTLLIVVCAMTVSASQTPPPASRIHKLAQLRWPQIDALDRDRTMFILPIGMLEEHGPHLPIASDTFGVTFEADGVARRMARSLRKWNVVVMPPLEYGQGGANIIRQYLKAALLDEMHISLIPILLGGGVRLFEDLDPEGIELRRTSSTETPGATHLRFELVK